MEFERQKNKPQFSARISETDPKQGELRHLDEASVLIQDGWAMRAFHRGCIHEIADHRTVGLQENFNHLDIQIFYPLNGNIALSILGTIADLVKTGTEFKDGDTSSDVLEDHNVKFVSSVVDGVKMLRVILPDKAGNLEKDKMAAPYSNQYEEI